MAGRCWARHPDPPHERCSLDAHGDEQDHAVMVTWRDEDSFDEDAVRTMGDVYPAVKRLAEAGQKILDNGGTEMIASTSRIGPLDPEKATEIAKNQAAAIDKEVIRHTEGGTPVVAGTPPEDIDWGGKCAACDHPKEVHRSNGCNGRKGRCDCLNFAG